MNSTVKRATLVLAMTPLMSLPAVGAFAATSGPATPKAAESTVTTTTDAPPATASAVAAKVNGVVTIGETSASAASSGGTAHADALDVLGTRVSGGDAKPGESNSGSLISTPDNPVGDLEIAPWSAKGSAAGPTTTAQAEAALAHAGLLGVLQLWLLHSQSDATWTSSDATGTSQSQGHSQSDGAEVNLADQLDVKVLHAETDSSGKGSSAVLVINGQGVLTSDQTGGSCAINADPLATILCLQASGGAGASGTTTSAASVVSETSGVGLPGATVVGGVSHGGKVAATPKKPATSTAHRARTPEPAATGSSTSGDRLPFTGTEAGLLALYGAVLTGLGAAITAAARRRRAFA